MQMIKNTIKLALLASCAMAMACPAYAASSTASSTNNGSGGVDTPKGVYTLPLAVEGTPIITLSDQATNSMPAAVNINASLPNMNGLVNVTGGLSVTGSGGFGGSLGVSGGGTILGGLELGTEGTSTPMAAGTSEYGPVLSFGGTTTNNTDQLYFQRYNENKDTTSLLLVIGDNAHQTYTPGSDATDGDAFIIGSKDSANGFNFVPNFTFTSNGRLGIGTMTPGYNLDVNGTANFSSTVTIGSSVTVGGATATSTTIDTANALGGLASLSACTAGKVLTKSGATTFSCISASSASSGSTTTTSTSSSTSTVPSGTMAGHCTTGTYADNQPGAASAIAPAIASGVVCSCQSGWTAVKTGSDSTSTTSQGQSRYTTTGGTQYYACIKN